MSPKAILVFCAQALLAQAVFGCPGNRLGGLAGYNGLAGVGLAGAGLGYGAGCGCGGVASTGGGLPIASASPIAPVGVSVLSENCYEGTLAAGGNLPFLGTVGIEGVLPTAGAGAVSYGCGDGAIGIGAEGPIGTGILSGQAFAPAGTSIGLGGLGAGYGIAGLGAGYGIAGLGAGYGLGGVAGLGAGCGCGGARII